MLQPPDRVPPKDFAQLLKKYTDQQCTEAEKRLVEKWFDDLGENLPLGIDAKDLQVQEEALWQRIKSKSVNNFPKAKVSELNNWGSYYWYSGVAATFLLIVACFWIFVPDKKIIGQRSDNAIYTINNHTLSDKLIRLPDGSQVSLKPAGKLRYNFGMANKREVFLLGEAFFVVTKNARRPFLVHSGKVVTKVLGTSFSVKYKGGKSQAVEVQVKTGRVAVSSQESKSGKARNKKTIKNQIELLPNQQAEFIPQIEEFKVQLVKAPAVIRREEKNQNQFIFRETDLYLVAQKLEKAYGIQIKLSENLKHCPLTADLSKEEFYAKLDLISGALQAKYTIRGTHIYLTGKGCQP